MIRIFAVGALLLVNTQSTPRGTVQITPIKVFVESNRVPPA